MRMILALGSHPDDVEWGALGYLLDSKADNTIHYVAMSRCLDLPRNKNIVEEYGRVVKELGVGSMLCDFPNKHLHEHGAYLDVTQGFPEQWGPVHIGNNVWIPNATILPNVSIGDNTVIAACSLVNKSIEGGGLWAGIPARKVEGVTYPNPTSEGERKAYLDSIGSDKEELRRHGIR